MNVLSADDEWMRDVSVMIVLWTVATVTAGALLLTVGRSALV